MTTKTLISELLSPYRKNTFQEQMSANALLKAGMKSTAKNHQGWKYFNHLLTKGTTGIQVVSAHDYYFHPDNVQSLCNKLGFIYLEDLITWLDSLLNVNVDGLIDTTNPSISFDLSSSIPMLYKDIKALLKEKLPLEYVTYWGQMWDSEYYPIPNGRIMDILYQCPYNKLPYIKDSRDCEDFAMLTKSFLRENGYGNLLMCYATIYIYDDQGKQFLTHGVNLAIEDDGNAGYKLTFIDSKNGAIWDASEKMKWGFARYNFKVKYLDF